MPNYQVAATPYFYNVYCPKHGNRMIELKTGLLEEKYWWCENCERVYSLAPKLIREDRYEKEKIAKQLKEMENK